jgi:hypothetical protein
MSDFITKKCDNCPKMKLENNGWWFIVRWLDNAKDTVFSVGHLGKEEEWKLNKKTNEGKYEIYHVCGHKCLIEKMSKLLGAINVGGDIKRVEPSSITQEIGPYTESEISYRESVAEKAEPNDV